MTGQPRVKGRISFWMSQLGRTSATRPPLGADHQVDVAIVGGGFTGLWTAYYLAKSDPSLRIAVLERELCGYGASGRNGGWLTAAMAGSAEVYAKRRGRDSVVALGQAMKAAVDEVIAVAGAEGIDADIVKGGELTVACNAAQDERLRADHAHAVAWGDHDHRLLDAGEVAQRVAVAGAVSGLWTPHGARIHPAKLVTGLAEVVDALGVEVYERTEVVAIEPHRVRTRVRAGAPAAESSGAEPTVRASFVVRATEGFTAGLPGERRTWLPMNSAMIVTEPLGTAVWDEIGWSGYDTVGDQAHAYMYAQRTADDRIAIGGRGVPYRYGSRTDHDGSTQRATIDSLRDVLARRFPAAATARLDHAWAGVLGVPRDWCAAVTLDRTTGLAAAGGYTGHGVATTNLAGRTLRDLILGEDTALTALPWVGHQTRRWEPEPLRWLGVQAMYAAYRAADRREDSRGGRTSWIARAADVVSGR